jgi:superfamily I DNA/RNA helicase
MPTSKVLAMTHSNKAAKELRKRLNILGISDVTAKTFTP